MKTFLKNWDYKKHAAAVTAFYLGTAVVGNAFLGEQVRKDEKSSYPTTVCCRMTKKQSVFNSILAVCYCMDMSATYLVLKHFKTKCK